MHLPTRCSYGLAVAERYMYISCIAADRLTPFTCFSFITGHWVDRLAQTPSSHNPVHYTLDQSSVSFFRAKVVVDMPSLDVIRADAPPELRPGLFGKLRNDVIAAVVDCWSIAGFLAYLTCNGEREADGPQREFIGTVRGVTRTRCRATSRRSGDRCSCPAPYS